MKRNRLGRSDIMVSEVCLGSMTWGEQNSETEAHLQMDYARDRGVNFIDTAELYPTPPRRETQGLTEQYIGTWLASRGLRAQTVIATKITGKGPKWIRDGRGISPKEIDIALHESLRNLGTDYVDLYQLHWPNRGSYHFGQQWNYAPDFDREAVVADLYETLDYLGECVKAGKIREVGLSNETSWGTAQFLTLAEKHDLPRVQSLQNEYSLLCRLFEPDLSELALAEDCGLLAWSPLATGLLTGKYANGVRPEGSRWSMLKGMPPRDTAPAHAAVAAYQKVAAAHGLSLTQMALAFVQSRPFTTSTIIGATDMTQLETVIDAFELTLGDDVLRDIAKVRREFPSVY